jgi:hypothetical protein
MRRRFFALALALVLTLAAIPAASAQRGSAAQADWPSVQSLPHGQKIIVRTKDGDRLTGAFDSADELRINFTDDGRRVSLTRESVRLVQLNRGKSRLNGALVGAAIGGGGGLGIGAWVHSYGDFNSVVVYGPGLVGAGIGAAIGAALGKGNRNETIYEAP